MAGLAPAIPFHGPGPRFWAGKGCAGQAAHEVDQLFGPRPMPMGCQRRSAVFCNTAGLTQLIGHLP